MQGGILRYISYDVGLEMVDHNVCEMITTSR